MQVLVVLAAAHRRIVSRDELTARCWRGRAVSEGALNRVISQLRKLPDEHGGGCYRLETVPRVGYGLTLIDVAVAPAGRATPPSSSFSIRSRRALLAASGLVAAGLAFSGFELWRSRPASRTRIAVLPFRAASKDLEISASALREDLVTSLLAIRDLEVVARASTWALQEDPNLQAGRDLGVTHTVEGSVQRDRVRLRINVSLTDLRRQSVIWSDQYESSDGDLFSLQAQAAKDVQGVLQMALTDGRIVQGRIDPSAYRLYAEGRALLSGGDAGGAVAKLKEATQRAPTFSRAWSLLGAAYVAQQGSIDTAAYTPLPRSFAKAAAAQAIALDPNNAEALSTLAQASDRPGAWDRIERLHRKAMDFEPSNVAVLYGAAGFYADVGWNDRAVEFLRRAQTLDALSPTPTFLLLRVLDATGNDREIDTLLSRAPPAWRANRSLWRFATRRAVWRRRYDEAERLIGAAPRQAASDAAYFSDLLACRRDPASPRLTTFTGPAYGGPLPETWPIIIFALGMLGQTDACIAFIRRVYESQAGREQAPTWVLHQQMVRATWTRPELETVFRELGLVAYWAARGRGPDHRLA